MTTTYYVDYENGDDANDGLSPEAAFKTVERAADAENIMLKEWRDSSLPLAIEPAPQDAEAAIRKWRKQAREAVLP